MAGHQQWDRRLRPVVEAAQPEEVRRRLEQLLREEKGRIVQILRRELHGLVTNPGDEWSGVGVKLWAGLKRRLASDPPQPIENFNSYLSTITINYCRDAQRHHLRKSRLPTVSLTQDDSEARGEGREAEQDLRDPAPDPATHVQSMDSMRAVVPRLWECLQQLPLPQRRAFLLGSAFDDGLIELLHTHAGVSLRQIAQLIEWPGNVMEWENLLPMSDDGIAGRFDSNANAVRQARYKARTKLKDVWEAWRREE